MTRHFFMRPLLISLGILLSGISGYAISDPLDDVGLEYQQHGVVATIRLTGQVNYLRHFPESRGQTLEIFYERPKGQADAQPWSDNEVRKSPASSLIPSFTVTTRDQATKPKLVVEFAREANFSVALGKDGRSLLVTIREDRLQAANVALPHLPVIPPEAVPAPGVKLTPEQANLADSNKQARALMVQGRDALAAGKNDAAVEVFNKLLLLPPNDFTQDGQEWVGVARERAGQSDKAKTEYDLYLRLFTQGEGVSRVVQRLANISGKGGSGIDQTGFERNKKQARWMSFGGISSRYYFSNSKIDSTQTFNGVPQTISLSMQDQSMLITSVDASERYMSEDVDARLVFRDVNTKNFLSNKSSLNRVNAAYGELKNRKQNYMLRVGRQNPTGGGVMGRFDGVAASFGDQDMRVNGVAGLLADYSQGTMPKFFSLSADRGAFSYYAINQFVEGTVDRRAVGSEWRYFEGVSSAFAQLEYDLFFKALNTAQIMGSVGMTGYTVNYLLDHRRAPTLSMRNALNGATTSSLAELVQSSNLNAVHNLALQRTSSSDMGQIGVSVPFRERWQAGVDFRMSKIAGYPETGTPPDPTTGTLGLTGFMPATEGRGTEYGVTGQLIGSGILAQGDVWSATTGFSKSVLANGYYFYLYNHELAKRGWGIDTTLMLFKQSDQFGGVTTRFSPMVRGTYRIREQLTFDVDFGLDQTKLDGAIVTTTINRYFGSAGLRWDF